jgi:hypothetical protein
MNKKTRIKSFKEKQAKGLGLKISRRKKQDD